MIDCLDRAAQDQAALCEGAHTSKVTQHRTCQVRPQVLWRGITVGVNATALLPGARVMPLHDGYGW